MLAAPKHPTWSVRQQAAAAAAAVAPPRRAAPVLLHVANIKQHVFTVTSCCLGRHFMELCWCQVLATIVKPETKQKRLSTKVIPCRVQSPHTVAYFGGMTPPVLMISLTSLMNRSGKGSSTDVLVFQSMSAKRSSFTIVRMYCRMASFLPHLCATKAPRVTVCCVCDCTQRT